ncbi:MAG TPA: FUSC family protein [Nocardioidaceae bacterium]|nr:FUSC family protein [Nocardioidaceae bacterium]HSE55043.1 FUSC family protein [Nocardioidaceae bacterium]
MSDLPDTLDRAWQRGRVSARARLARVSSKSWHIGQAAVAAALAWVIAKDVLGHPTPFFAPIAAVVCLGTSYGQRLRRVAEVTVGVAVGVFVADLLVLALGTGWWQLGLVVALAMSAAVLLDTGGLLVTQAAVQSIIVTTLLPDPDQALLRWTDALVGGAVALVAAAVVPGAPLRRPRERAAVVVRKIASLLRTASESAVDGDLERALAMLASARTTEPLIRELQAAADEGMSVVASSPFRRRHRGQVRRMTELIEPLDRAMRNTRVLVRRVAVAIYHGEQLPRAYAVLCADLADVTDEMAAVLERDEMASGVRDALIRIGYGTAEVERVPDLSAEVVLAQIRSIIVDLLQITGLDVVESTDALPPAR